MKTTSIQKILRNFREKHELTQRELGLAMGIPPGVAQARIGHYEAGIRRMPPADILRFLRVVESKGERIRAQQLDSRLRFVEGKLYQEVTIGE